MIRALWSKAFREGWWLLVGSASLLFAFEWIRVWLVSQVHTAGVRKLLQFAPDILKKFLPVPLDVLASPAGRIAAGYDDPLVVMVVCIWAIARASDGVGGEIGRGTMEMLLAQPVRRIHIVWTHAAVTVLGLLAIVGGAWLGSFAALQVFEMEEPVAVVALLPAALNLFSLGFFLAGATALLSAMDRSRTRAIGVVVGFFAVEIVVKLVAVSSASWRWLRYGSVLTAFEPQRMAYYFWPEMLALQPEESWRMMIEYNGLLLALGLAGHLLGAAIFCRRDLPAPL